MNIAEAWLGEDDEGSLYQCECPECNELLDLSDDFKWSGKFGKYAMEWPCEYCGAEIIITRR